MTPVLTLVLYLGEKPWDAAGSLHELLNFEKIPEKLKRYIPDYSVTVLDVCHTSDERLLEVVERFPMFQSVSEDAYDAVWTYTNERKL